MIGDRVGCSCSFWVKVEIRVEIRGSQLEIRGSQLEIKVESVRN